VTTYSDIAASLRGVANQLEVLEPDLPAPSFEGGCTVTIAVEEPADVYQVSEALDIPAFASMGEVSTRTRVGAVMLRFATEDAS